jgi:hypothetical protein
MSRAVGVRRCGPLPLPCCSFSYSSLSALAVVGGKPHLDALLQRAPSQSRVLRFQKAKFVLRPSMTDSAADLPESNRAVAFRSS